MRCHQQANAKINLGLRILKRLPNGYHNIETIFIELDWGDKLTAEPDNRLTLECHGIPVPQDENNLVLRAARMLQDRSRVTNGARIMLEKRIPVGSGLGGGSSDAAATLLVLSRLWNLDLEMKDLALVAGKLGADIPFFLTGGMAYATGIGDKLEPVSWAYYPWVVLYHPGWEISTPWAYRQWDLLEMEPANPLPLTAYLNRSLDDPEFRQVFSNDFQQIVFREYPALGEVSDQLRETGADYVSLSGSGSSLFGLFAERDRAEAALKWAQSQGWAKLTRFRQGERSETR